LPLDEDARDILGDVPGQDNSDPADLQPEVLRRWHHWLFQGLDKEEREYLLSLYPVVSTILTHAVLTHIPDSDIVLGLFWHTAGGKCVLCSSS